MPFPRLSFQDLANRKARTVLTATAVAISVMAGGRPQRPSASSNHATGPLDQGEPPRSASRAGA